MQKTVLKFMCNEVQQSWFEKIATVLINILGITLAFNYI